MSYDKQKVINIALAEVGYLEKASNSQLDSKTANVGNRNYTKYARDLANAKYFNGNKQGIAWCATFVSWCFFKAYGKADALKLQCQPTGDNCGAGCLYARNYYKSHGQLYDSPEAGDQIFFGDASSVSHTGLVVEVKGGRVYTVEGNTSGASGVVSNGGGVCRKSYPLSYGRIYGYGRPNYGVQDMPSDAPGSAESATDSDVDKYTTYTVQKGDTLWRIAQKQLGQGNRYKEIASLNNLSNPNKISIGQKIKIPTA